MKALKRIGIVLAILMTAAAAGGLYLLGSEAVPETTRYEIDLSQLRHHARSMSGPPPTEIRYETIGIGSLPRALIMAGEDFDPVAIPRPVFQILYPAERFILIDSAYDRALHEAGFADQPFFDRSWERLVAAMEAAAQIVVSHDARTYEQANLGANFTLLRE